MLSGGRVFVITFAAAHPHTKENCFVIRQKQKRNDARSPQQLILPETVATCSRDVSKVEKVRDVRTLDEVDIVVGFPRFDVVY